MNIYQLILFLLLFSSSIEAQIKSGEVTYRLGLEFHPSKSSQKNNAGGNSTLANMIRGSQQDLAAVKGVLKFNSNVSLFTPQIPMENDNNPNLSVALSLLGLGDTNYYSNTEKGLNFKVLKEFGKTFLIEGKVLQTEDWKISSDTREIGEYKVFKATINKVVQNSKGKFNQLVTAWFAPKIPFSFGPVGYGGLPGLILELDIDSNFPSKYVVESYNFKDKKTDIKMPEGRRISSEELQKMAKKAMGNLGE